ncbi:uncharacterized protein LOC129578468 [Sitodiplosis mosellana]|uniref:uncharacterized protein LOC129578468 n=1 Tax=Sitodiplosis mosellana TaxID=263140 RepID=UPI0024445520|nr:uncharacterized protein LOC129578468 [Sitodiplosis mosellana]
MKLCFAILLVGSALVCIFAVQLPDIYNRRLAPNGFYMPRLETGAATRLHPSELAPVAADAHKVYEITANFEPLSSALGQKTFTSSPFITDLIDPVKDSSLTAKTKAALNKQDGTKLYAKVLQVHLNGNMYNALKITEQNSDPSAEQTYWASRGGYVDVPLHPKQGDPTIVLTPSFSGGSLAVDLLKDGKTIRIYHLQGGREDRQYNNVRDHGLGLLGAMEYKHYGYHIDQYNREIFVEHNTGSAFVQYVGSTWVIRYQMIESIPSITRISNIKIRGSTVHTTFPQSSQIVGYGEAVLNIPKK